MQLLGLLITTTTTTKLERLAFIALTILSIDYTTLV
jgi:predicted transcriptional regulator